MMQPHAHRARLPVRFEENRGFTLIELVLVIVIIGILAAVMMRSGRQIYDDTKMEQAKQELTELSRAVAGNPDLLNNGVRADFGYVGDVGALPDSLGELMNNPGGWSTWKGPYVSNDFVQATGDFKQDPWGSLYAYNPGTATIASSGSGSNLVRHVAPSPAALLYNRVSGIFTDADGTPPGADSDSSVALLTFPNGHGGLTTRACTTDVGGYFNFDSIPVGNHTLRVVYRFAGGVDTLLRTVSVNPGSEVYTETRSPYDLWSAGAITNGLVGYWRLDETSGTVAADASGYGHDGTLMNMNPGSDWVPGHIGGALRFDGNDDEIDIPDSDLLDDTPVITVTCWVYPTRLDGDPRGPVSKRVYYTAENSWSMFFYGGNRVNIDVETNNNRFASNRVFTPNQWYHLAFVYDGNLPSNQRVKFYVDGVLDRTAYEASSAISNTNSPMVIGQLNGNEQGFFEGLIDDVRVYRRALDPAEIAQLAAM